VTSTYPPEHHVIRDLRMVTFKQAVDHCLVWVPAQPNVRADDGALRLGVIGALIDSASAVVALAAAAPDWIATADLAYHSIEPVREGPAICSARVLRAGVGVVVVRVEVFDGHGDESVEQGSPAGVGLVTFSRIPSRATVLRIDPFANIGTRMSNARPDSGYDIPLHDKLGLRVVDPAAGIVELDKHDYVRNSFGTINGGALCMLAEAGAEHAANAATGGRYHAADLQVHYLAQTKVGPARSRTRVVRADDHHVVCDLRVVDAGNQDVVLAVATVTLLARR
jgi:acyl-coenzyme A thioesterase PaaI-like protein